MSCYNQGILENVKFVADELKKLGEALELVGNGSLGRRITELAGTAFINAKQLHDAIPGTRRKT